MPTIRTKILKGFSVVLMIGIMLGATGVFTVRVISHMSAEQRKLQTIGTDVTTVLEAHYKWRHDLLVAVSNGTEFTGSLDPSDCALGKWIESGASEVTDRAVLDMLSKVSEPHSYIHTEAKRIRQFLEEGDRESARVYLNDYVLPATTEVISILSAMYARCVELVNEQAARLGKFEFVMSFIIISLLTAAVASGIIISVFISAGIEKQLKAIIGKLSISTKEILSTVSNLTEVSQRLADGSSKQAAAIEQTSATMNESSSMVVRTAENTRTASELSKLADSKSKRSLEKIRSMLESMEKLQELGGEISRIVKTIDNIAFNTNLLAINATIESARTGGEAGKSFAVVADEVRELALKSSQSAAETSDIILTNIELTDKCNEMSGSVAEELNDVSEEIKNLSQILSDINTASEEQSRGIVQVNIAIGEMEKVTQDNASVSEETSASSLSLKEEAKNLEAIITEATKLIVSKE